MSPDETKPRSSLAVWLIWLIAVLLAIPTAYVLSLGPVHWLNEHGYLNERTKAILIGFYGPLSTAVLEWPWLQRFLNWYMSFWR